MWDVYFGQWKEGRLKRLAYLGYDVLLLVPPFVILLVIMIPLLNVGKVFGDFGAPIADSVMHFFDTIGFIGVIGFILIFIAIAVANLNIMAKRIRDMGLPAWGTVIGIILISMVLGALFPAQQVAVDAAMVETSEGISAAAMNAQASHGSVVANLFNFIVFLSLVFIPSDTFNKDKSPQEV